MSISMKPLEAFRDAATWTGKGIANLDGYDDVRQNGTYGGFLTALGRSDPVQKANNKARTELLTALGRALHIAGMERVEDNDGNTHIKFTEKFMDRLQEVIGDDLKRDDFAIGADGTVTSGRPLTARRIRAILAKVDAEASKPNSGVVSTVAPEGVKLSARGGLHKDDIYRPYLDRLDVIKRETAGLDPEKNEHVFTFFKLVAKSFDYLYDELDVERRDEGANDPSSVRNKPSYEYLRSLGENAEPKFEFYDDTKGEYVLLTDVDSYNRDFLWYQLGGGLLHIERTPFCPTGAGRSTDISVLRRYMIDQLRLFVMKSIDTYFASKEQGKLDVFFEHLRKPGACIEDKSMNLIMFEEKHLSDGLQAVSKAESIALTRIANSDPEELDCPRANTLFEDFFNEVSTEPWFADKEGFDAEVEQKLSERFLGKTVKHMKFNTKTNKFDIPVLENGRPVVKPLTAADIRDYGRLVYSRLYE